MLDRLQNLVSRLAQIMAWLAGVGLVAMVAIVVLDVLARHLAPGFSIHGAIELVALLMVVVGFFGLPAAFDRRTHLNVEVATAAAPVSLRRGLDVFWSLVGAGVVLFLCWMALDTGTDLQRTGQVSEILRIKPLVTYGIAALGLGVALLAALNGALGIARGRVPVDNSTEL